MRQLVKFIATPPHRAKTGRVGDPVTRWTSA